MRLHKISQLNYWALIAAVTVVLCGGYAQVWAAEPEVHTTNSNFVTRVAPGELLPISIKLINFGGTQKADVVITYRILDHTGVAILTNTETVAVETTASFTKVIQIPAGTKPGAYTAQSSIEYQGQKVPATSSYEFTVEQKIGGIFLSDFIIYGIVTLCIGIVFAVVSRLIMKKRRVGRFAPHEYSEIPAAERMYYEIISDTLMQMRYRVGDRAVDIAKGIEDLIVDADTGKVLKIKKNPAHIIALLVSEYEKLLGKKVSFAFQEKSEIKKHNEPETDKNLVIIAKR